MATLASKCSMSIAGSSESNFLVRLRSSDMLILETKDQDTEQDKVKRQYLEEWVQAVNAHGKFERWRWAVARHPGEINHVS